MKQMQGHDYENIIQVSIVHFSVQQCAQWLHVVYYSVYRRPPP